MSERDKTHAPNDLQIEPHHDPMTRVRGDGEGEEEGTPPGGDVRAIYSEDRAPGEAEPEDQPS